MDICTITGTIYNPDGSAAEGVTLRIVKATKAGQLITSSLFTMTPSDAGGNISFDAPQGATVWLYGDVVGLDVNGVQGVPFVVPSEATGELSTLVPASSVPGTVPVVLPGSNSGAYTHTQSTPALTWTIAHNLARRPVVVQLFDSSYNVIEGAVGEVTDNSVTVDFNVAQSGFARIL